MTIIIITLSASLLLSLFWNLKQYNKYNRRIKPNWEILEDRLTNIGLAIIRNASESNNISKKIESLEQELSEFKDLINKGKIDNRDSKD